MKSISTGQVDGASQVGQEEAGPLQHPDEQRWPAGVVGRDLVAELPDPALEVGLRTPPSRRRGRRPAREAGVRRHRGRSCGTDPTGPRSRRRCAGGRLGARTRRPPASSQARTSTAATARTRATSAGRRGVSLGVAGGLVAPEPAAHRPASQGDRALPQGAGVGRVDPRPPAARAGRRRRPAGRPGGRGPAPHPARPRRTGAAGPRTEPGCGGTGRSSVRGVQHRRPGRRPAHSARPSRLRPQPQQRAGGCRPSRPGSRSRDEAVEGGAAQHGQQDGLGLVVHGVSGQDPGWQGTRSEPGGPGPRGPDPGGTSTDRLSKPKPR